MATRKEKKSRKAVRKSSHTRKRAHSHKTDKSMFVKSFLEVLNMVKLYHWKTHSYAEHNATDDLYSSLNGHMDTFVEILMGKDESRVRMLEKRIRLMDFSSKSNLKKKIYEFREFLIDMNMHLDSSRDSDLLSVRDEILGDINKFLYLLTLHK